MPTQIEDSQLELHDVSAEERDFSKHYRLRDPEHTTEELVKINGRNLNSTLARSPVDDSQMRGSTDAITFCDADNRKRRKNSTSPSGSGTEADDESGPFLRGLPAPPARLRKGLKNETTLGTPSPLLTPSYLDDEKRRQTLEAQFKRRASPQSHPSTDEETVRIREKFKKRRRAELLRRITETLLFLGVGCSACRKVLQLPVQRELAIFVFVVCGAYLLYPIRLYYYHRMLPEGSSQPRQFLRVPAAFDPATLLYPVLLPAFVAASLQSRENVYVIVNVILGIAAMPRTIVPSQDNFSGHTSVQYLLSVLPLAGLDSLHSPTAASPEILSLLYPLHQALLPSLGYLTTTSLLPSELQLMSISMINVFIFSSSPQSLILKALTWIGGLSIFVLCRRVLEWEVALARIPSWRFRRDNEYNRLYLVLKRILKELVGGRPSHFTYTEEASDKSDSDKPHNFVRRIPQRRSRGISFATSNGDSTLSRLQTAMTLPAKESLSSSWPLKTDGTSSPSPSHTRRQRSSTLPLCTGPTPGNLGQCNDRDPSSTIQRLSMPKSFRSLTKEQATVVKWLYAWYTYAAVTILTAIPIRIYIGRYALHRQEPVGWALGYLLGDIHQFRSVVTAIGLEKWCQLSSTRLNSTVTHEWAENIRWNYLGAANTRLLICLHCLITIGLGLAVVFRLSAYADVDTRRKVFHGMMVVMFLPTIFVDPTFVALALTLVLAIFLLLDLFRASQVPPLSRPLTYFLAPYVDGRDHRGPVIVSHMFLLIGCSIPLWLSLASVERSGTFPWQGWEVPTRDLSMISGVVCVGMGDAAASLVGRRYGRRRWCWSGGKSLEGSAAFAVAVVLGLSLARLWLLYGEWHGSSGDSWPVFYAKATVAASGASLTEAALTGGNDNVIVPLILWLLVRGLAI